ncbi:MAG: LPS assembly lipoprotein LptE [Roseivirga sp.]
MTWTRISFGLLTVLLLLQGCGIYSFSGTSLSSEIKSFSLQCQSRVALGPPDLAEQFTERLGKELMQRTPLKQVDIQQVEREKIQLEVTITQFKYTPVAPSAGSGNDRDSANTTRLIIEVQVNYVNPKDEEASFSKKKFSQFADMQADASTDQEEPRLVEEIFTKLAKDIFNASVASW